jgi:hypothetical protein
MRRGIVVNKDELPLRGFVGWRKQLGFPSAMVLRTSTAIGLRQRLITYQPKQGCNRKLINFGLLEGAIMISYTGLGTLKDHPSEGVQAVDCDYLNRKGQRWLRAST